MPQSPCITGSATCRSPIGAPTDSRDDPHECSGVQLLRCKATRDDFEKIADCASEALCLKSKDLKAGACLTPKCGKGSGVGGGPDAPHNKCVDGVPYQCEAAQQGYTKQAACMTTTRCNPADGQCVPLAIDAAEVTRGEYQEFAKKPPATTLSSVCGWNKDYRADPKCVDDGKATVSCLDGTPPDCAKYPALCPGGAPPSCDSFPQTCVDWCDAYDYCASKGKHLCGALGKPGTMVLVSSFADAGKSERMNACSAGGEQEFAMKGSNPSNSCNGETYWSSSVSQPLPVKVASQCVSGIAAYAGVFDLSGNVAEWENACAAPHTDPDGAGTVKCHVRGGSYEDESTASLRCAADKVLARSDRLPSVGFRCCGP